MSSTEAVMIVSKFPKAGESKTRLASKIGNNESALLARAMLDDLMEKVRGKYRHILVGREKDRTDFRSAYSEIEFVSGGGQSQFNDILASIKYAFQALGMERLIFLASDIPTLGHGVIAEGFRELQSHDVVYAPSQDGASLIGFNRSTIFNTSSSLVEYHALEASKSREADHDAMNFFKSYHCNHPDVYQMPIVSDIDSLDDLIHHSALLSTENAPKTMNAVGQLATDETFLFRLCCKVGEDSSPKDKRMVGDDEIIDDSGPKIGAVIVKDRKFISTGYRFELGLGRHAEDCAIEKGGSSIEGATLYSTFEPCTFRQSTFGLSCCSDLIHKSGIREVVYGTPDPQLPHSATKQLTPRGVIVRQSDDLAMMSMYLTSVYMEKLKSIIKV